MKKLLYNMMSITIIFGFGAFSVYAEEDHYENDDSSYLATTYHQEYERNFHHSDDIDWIMFYGENQQSYTISVQSASANISMELYASDAKTMIQSFHPVNRISWKCDLTQIYYLKLFCQLWTEPTSYTIIIKNKNQSDLFEPDNSIPEAKVITIDDSLAQQHCFHDINDTKKGDWVKFFGIADSLYQIDVENVGDECDPVIHILNSNNSHERKPVNIKGKGYGEESMFIPETDGIYYIQITSSDDSDIFDFRKTFYQLSISFKIAPYTGVIVGNIYNSCNDTPLKDVTIKLINKNNNNLVLTPQLSNENGRFIFKSVPPLENAMVLFEKMFSQYHIDFEIEPTQIKVYDNVLLQIDDLNSDNQVGLSDIINGIQILSSDEMQAVNNDCVSLSTIIFWLKLISQ